MMAQNKQPNKPFCVVYWNDAWSDDSEASETEMLDHKPIVCANWGWLVQSGPAGVTLASEWSPDDGKYRHVQFVPRAMIIEEIILKVQRVRKKKVVVEAI